MSDSEQLQHGFSMADVASKPITYRLALASGKITVGEEAFVMLRDGSLPKGDALALAESRLADLLGSCKPMANVHHLDESRRKHR